MLRVFVTVLIFERSLPCDFGNDRFGYGSGTVARVSARCKKRDAGNMPKSMIPQSSRESSFLMFFIEKPPKYFKNKKQTLYEPQQPEGIAAALRKTAAPERGKTDTRIERIWGVNIVRRFRLFSALLTEPKRTTE